MISTDRGIFEKGSAVRARQREYAKAFDEVHIIVFETARHAAMRAAKKGSMTPQYEEVIAPNCFAYSTHSLSKVFYPFDAGKLGRFICRSKAIDAVTCQDASFTAIVGIALKRRFGANLEIQVHEDLSSPRYASGIQSKVRRALALSQLPRADHIRVVSERLRSFMVDRLNIDPAKVEVRPIAIDAEAIRMAEVTDSGDIGKAFPAFKKSILVVSRLEPEKNVSLALDAFAALRIQEGVGMVIAGEGSERTKLEKLASTRGITGRVVFAGSVDQQTLYGYYKTCTVVLHTSLYEGYGMSLAEAHAAGARIVSTDVGIAREVGATIVPWDARAIADSVARILAL